MDADRNLGEAHEVQVVLNVVQVLQEALQAVHTLTDATYVPSGQPVEMHA